MMNIKFDDLIISYSWLTSTFTFDQVKEIFSKKSIGDNINKKIKRKIGIRYQIKDIVKNIRKNIIGNVANYINN